MIADRQNTFDDLTSEPVDKIVAFENFSALAAFSGTTQKRRFLIDNLKTATVNNYSFQRRCIEIYSSLYEEYSNLQQKTLHYHCKIEK